MSKTYEDYLADSSLRNMPEGLRITYAMRLKVQDDIAGMNQEQRASYFRNGTKKAFQNIGVKPNYTSSYSAP
jgi:hypothetical protein